jgi:hypothetical protein
MIVLQTAPSRPIRTVATAIVALGMVAFVAIGVTQLSSGEDPGGSVGHTQSGSEPVTFEIGTRLSPGQVSGKARVTINGQQAGVLTIDQTNPTDEISHTVPEPGTYSYTIEATGVVQDAYGASHQLTGFGQGNIEVEQGSDYALSGNISGNTWQVSLVGV